MAVGMTALTAAAERLHTINDGDKAGFVACAPIDPRAPESRNYDDVLAAYAPLVEWLEPELDRLQVLCISGDPGLLDVPMHMVPVGGRPLIDWVGVTAAPSAALLAHMTRASNRRGRAATLFNVPRAGDGGAASNEATLYDRLAHTMANLTDTVVLTRAEADLAALRAAPLAGRLVHFATHGTFDPTAPLDRSGIFLAHAGRLPDGESSADHLACPELLARLDFRDAWVVISACLCGRSREVTPGEALGTLWALVQGGAASVMAAHWRVDIGSAVAFFEEFYRAWLGEKLPAWQAHRRAVQHVRKLDPSYRHPYHWAPFVLHGPWD